MARQILRIRDLGQSTFWQLMQMEGQPAPLTGKTALLLAADGADTQDVLAATAAARQLGMDVDMLPPALWAQDMASCDLQAPLYAHAGLCLTAGLKGGALDCLTAGLPGAVVNAGNDKGAPGQALADLALLAARHGDWESLRISWLGGAQCGLACDLITAAIYAPFELFMALPEWGEPDHSLLDMALRAGAKIFLSRDPELVLENAHAVYMGHGPEQCAAAPLTSGWPPDGRAAGPGRRGRRRALLARPCACRPGFGYRLASCRGLLAGTAGGPPPHGGPSVRPGL